MPLDQPKFIFSLVYGLISLGIGIIPFTAISSSLPAFLLLHGAVLAWFSAMTSLIFIILSFLCQDDQLMWTLAIMGLIICGFSSIIAFSSIKVISFSLPFITDSVLRIMLSIVGAGLIIDAFGSK